MVTQNIFALFSAIAIGVGTGNAAEAASIFSDRTSFENQLDTFLVDDYSNPGYLAGDSFNGANFDIHTDTNISSIVGETRYTTTGFPNNNFIPGQSSGDPYYCAGCNGSFWLDFTTTSVGDSSGVFGIGFDIEGESEGVFGTFAFVTFGNGSTDNFFLPERTDAFWGITSDSKISSIHFGLENGGFNTRNNVQRMALDNLTVGSGGTTNNAIPEPTSTIAAIGLSATIITKTLKKKKAG